MRTFKKLTIVLFTVSTCLFAADPNFLRRQVSDVRPQPDDLTANAKQASYKPLFGIGDKDADQLQGVARYGELTVAPGGTSAIVSYPAEEQMYFIEDGRATLLYGDEKVSVKKNDFLYLPAGVRHGVANSSDAPARVIVMGYKIPAGTKVEPTLKLMLATADEVPLQVLGSHGPTTQFKLLMGLTSSTRDKLSSAYVMDSLFLMDFAAGGTNIPHNHRSEEEIYLLLRGSGDMVAGLDADRKEVRHAVTAGATFFIKPGTQIGYYSKAKEGQEHDLILAVRSRLPGAIGSGQSPAPRPTPAGKAVPRPLYRDPPFDAPTDPVFCFNAEQNKWFMYYTARRATAADAPGVTWVHGSNIGMAESSDGGATWTYRGLAEIEYGKDTHPTDYTYWAPEVIWYKGTYHMYLTFVPGIFNDWNHPREIVHLTSKDGVKWDAIGPVDLQSDRVIDACVIQLPDGTWRMWYKDERKPKALSYADSPDLFKWQAKGNAVTDRNGEGPKVIHWKGKYWLIADTWATGMRVWRSDDCEHWTPQDETLIGSHGDVVISGDRAWWFFFGGRIPAGQPDAPRPASRRATAINVLELSVVDGKLIAGDPARPTFIDLKSVREAEN